MMDVFMMINDEDIPDFAGLLIFIQLYDGRDILAFQDTRSQPKGKG